MFGGSPYDYSSDLDDIESFLNDGNGGGGRLNARAILIPFDVVVPKRRRSALDQDARGEEGEAVLAWLVQGAIDYAARLAHPGGRQGAHRRMAAQGRQH